MNKVVSISGNKVQFSYVADKSYKQLVLRELDFVFYEEQHIAIVGANGSGKSTLARQLNALLLPDAGTITMLTDNNEVLITDNPEHTKMIRKNVGMVFQNPENQIVAATVEDDIVFGMENLGLNYEEMHQRLQEALKKMQLENTKTKEPWQLSGGQKQRVAIAGILAMRPSFIVLDEATSMLDSQGRTEVMTTINKLKKNEKITLIHITHDMQEAIMADIVYIMHEGKLKWQGKPSELCNIKASSLEEWGLELPFNFRFSHKLIEQGIKIKPTDSLEKLVEQLCK